MILPSMMKFQLGRLVITPAVLSEISVDDICRAVDRHVCGQWGEVPDLVRVTNENGLLNRGHLLSAFQGRNGIELRLFTTADRLSTTVHLSTESIQ